VTSCWPFPGSSSSTTAARPAHAGGWLVYPLVNEIPEAIGEDTRELAIRNQPGCPKTMALVREIPDLSLASVQNMDTRAPRRRTSLE
jgi:hypothetical protein